MPQKYFGTNVPVSSGFDINSQRPLDPRTVVEHVSDLESIPNIQLYAGLEVYIEEKEAKYYYNGSEWKDSNSYINELHKIIQDTTAYNATSYGLSTENEGFQNSQSLQQLIDQLSDAGGGVIFIPAGTYIFSSNGKNTIGERCIKMKSHISIFGEGANTILKPTGHTTDGLDMFYFNDYADTGYTTYLENCRFENFVIDGADTSCSNYTSCGKGFMFNLFRDCYWKNVIVRNTDATGFGVDCPINSSIQNCTAYNCGKAGENNSPGASGFGIGFGYSQNESMTISECYAISNKHFGVFFEHQRRFNNTMYTADNNKGFIINSCTAYNNYYNMGCIQGINVQYKNCYSYYAYYHGFYIENSDNCNISNCYSNTEMETSFAIVANDYDSQYTVDVRDLIIQSCICKNSGYGVRIVNNRTSQSINRCIIKDCTFDSVINNTIYTQGNITNLILINNAATNNENNFIGTVNSIIDNRNTWNLDIGAIWKNKTFAAFGTSITYLCNNYNGGYLEEIKQLCGFSDYGNAGVSGAPMVNNTKNGNGINYSIKNTNISRDLVLIECCTNDFKLNVPIGNIETTNIDTFSGALKDAIEHLINNYPHIPIVIIADPQRDNDRYDVNYTNSAGCKLIDYIDMAILIGNKYGIPVCDLYRNSGINSLNLDTYTVDGLHPNEAGYKMIGKCVSGILNTMNSSANISAPIIDSEVQIDGEYYDISQFIEQKYKLIINISGTYYMYESHMPIWIYSDGDSYYEAFDLMMTSRSTASNNIFENPTQLTYDGIEYLDDIFARVKTQRNIDQFVCSNHDIYLWGTNTKILRKSFD